MRLAKLTRNAGPRCGDQFVKQLQLLLRYFHAQIGHTRDVAARLVEAGNKPNVDRVETDFEHDGNGCSRRLSGQ